MEHALARSTDPGTSHEAARSMTETRLTALQRLALAALKSLGGIGINDSIVTASAEDWNTITPRMAPLERKGMVERAGRAPGSKGKFQTLWAITAKGRAFLADAR